MATSCRRSMPTWFLMATMVAAVVASTVSPAAASTSHVVGGQAWTIQATDPTFYSKWAANQTFAVGDKLVFNFPTGRHDVIEVPKSSYDACSSSNQIGATLSTGPATLTISSAGTHYYICGFPGHCSAGQKLAITVPSSNKPSPPTPAPAPTTSPAGKGAKTSAPTPAPAPSPAGMGKGTLTPVPAPSPAAAEPTTKSHVVGDQTAWTIPPNASFYSDWAATQTFAIGDRLVFNFPTGRHDVIEVPQSSYDACSSSNQIGATLSTGPATITISSAGTHYYICGFPSHCSEGQKLAVTTGSSSSSPTPPPISGSPTAPAPNSNSAVALSSSAAVAVALFLAMFFH